MITLNSGVIKSLTVETEVSGKKTQISVDAANKNASCSIDLTEPVAPGTSPQPYPGAMSNVRVSVNYETDNSLVSTTNVADVDGAAAMAKLAIAKIKEVVTELETL